MKLTIQDIAKLSGNSPSTVSRVLNNHPSVSDKSRKKILDIINEQNYTPSRLARSLSTDGYDAILVIYTRLSSSVIDNPYFSIIVSAIGSIAEEHNFDIILQSGTDISKDIKKAFSMIKDKLIKGIILLSSRVNDKLIAALSGEKIPVVVIGKIDDHIKSNSIISVDTDNFSDCKQITDFLVKMGHKNIACIHAPLNHYVSLERVKGFRHSLNQHKIKINENWLINGEHTIESSYEAALKLLCTYNDITAIFATDDIKALGVYKAANKLCIKIPEELSVVGHNDYEYSRIVTPSLTTVRVPIFELGIVSAKKLFSLIKNNTIEGNTILPTEFKIRDSVKTISD